MDGMGFPAAAQRLYFLGPKPALFTSFPPGYTTLTRENSMDRPFFQSSSAMA